MHKQSTYFTHVSGVYIERMYDFPFPPSKPSAKREEKQQNTTPGLVARLHYTVRNFPNNICAAYAENTPFHS